MQIYTNRALHFTEGGSTYFFFSVPVASLVTGLPFLFLHLLFLPFIFSVWHFGIKAEGVVSSNNLRHSASNNSLPSLSPVGLPRLVVYEDEPSSIIAHTLNSPKYADFLRLRVWQSLLIVLGGLVLVYYFKRIVEHFLL